MKSILMTTSAVILVTGFAAGQAQAACPEDIDAFDREYDQALQNAVASEGLSTSEQAHLFGLRTAAENLHQAGNAEMCAAVIERANLMLESTIAPQVIRPDELIGREVRNGQDEDLGEIEEVMLDPISGRIAYVVVEHGGFLGIGEDLFAVPWQAMQFVPGDDQTLLLDIPEEKLENAPRFSRDDESALERREWVTSVHSYYGVQPYWSDEIGTMVMQYGGGGVPADTGGTIGAAGGSETGAGEVKTIVVPITQPDSAEQPQSEAQSEATGARQEQTGQNTEEESGAETGSGTQADSQSTAGQQTGAASLVAAQPPAEGAEDSSADVEALVARMDELEQRVQDLAQKDTEVERSIDSLEQQAQQLSEKMPGEEVTQAIDRLEKQVAALEEAGQATGQGSDTGQGAAGIVVPGQTGQSGQSGGQDAQQQDGQSDQPSTSSQSGAAAQPGAGQQSQGQAGGQASGEQGQAGGQQDQGEQGQAGGQQDQAGGQQDQPSDEQGQGSGQQGQPDSQQGQASTEQQQAVATQGATTGSTPSAVEEPAGEACEEQIAQLEKDLKRAEGLGVETKDAQSELKEAQAMLNNNSEALCRAAIKRAHEELVAVGFEVPQGN